MESARCLLVAVVSVCVLCCHGFRVEQLNPSKFFNNQHAPASPPPYSGSDAEYDVTGLSHTSRTTSSAAAASHVARVDPGVMLSVILDTLTQMAMEEQENQRDGLASTLPRKRATFWTPLRGPLPVDASFDEDDENGKRDDLLQSNLKPMRYGRK